MKWFIHDKDLLNGSGYGCVPQNANNLATYRGHVLLSFEANSPAEAIERLYAFEHSRGKR